MRFSGTVSLPLLLALALSSVSGAGAGQQTSTTTGALDPKQDTRLATRVRVQSEGIPLRTLLGRLSDRTGVRLEVTGTAADERVIAFVPSAPLAEVLDHLADLYRLSWSGDRKIYRLRKSPAAAREEQALRNRAFRQVTGLLQERLGNPAAAVREDARERGGQPSVWAPLFPQVFPLLAPGIGRIPLEGHYYVDLAGAPPATREKLAASLQPVLEEQHRRYLENRRRLQEEWRAMGQTPPPAPEPPLPKAEEGTLLVELSVEHELRLTAGYRSNSATWSPWLNLQADDLRSEALALYRDRNPRLPEQAGGMKPLPPPAGTGPLDRNVELAPDPNQDPKDWIATLRRLSAASGVSLYADCYSDYLNGYSEHPRSHLPAAGRGSVREWLDTLGFPPGKPFSGPARANSFWWQRGNTALVRSAGWLWDSQRVLPADLTERIVASVRRSGRLDPADLAGLANLTYLQVRQGGNVAHHLDHWDLAVRLTGRLSPAARAQALAKDGVTWVQLRPADREIVARFYPAGRDPSRFRARLSTEVRHHPAQGGAILTLSFVTDGMLGSHPFHLSLPGVRAVEGLPETGLSVELVRD